MAEIGLGTGHERTIRAAEAHPGVAVRDGRILLDRKLVEKRAGFTAPLPVATALVQAAAKSIGAGDVKLELFEGSAKDSVISDATSNDGYFSWTIPSEQPPGDDYKVRITKLVLDGHGIYRHEPGILYFDRDRSVRVV